MKSLVIKSNHGNHRGFNREWEILEEFNDIILAKAYLAKISNNVKVLYEDDEDFETSLESFEDDLYYYYVITEKDYSNGIFNGGHFGYANEEIKSFFE